MTLAEQLADLLADAFVRAAQRPDVVAAVRAAFVEPAPVQEKTTGLTKKEIARAIGKSVASVDRFDKEGAPHTFVGDTKRYEVTGYRSWLASRGKKPTRARATKGSPDVDVTDVLAANGLAVDGGRPS